MKTACVVLTLLALAAAKAPSCDPAKCKLPNCVCYGDKPTIDVKKLPQIVLITADDAITKLNFDTYWKPAYFGRVNPDKCQIGATFFVPHEWTDYSKVHELYANGFEIGVNSITKDGSSEYWRKADVKLLEQEFGGQKQILTKFASVPADDIRGERSPNLQMASDKTFDSFKNSKLVYDSSWLTRKEDVWPYTLDFKSDQDCVIDPCPTEEHKSTWVSPINVWKSPENQDCATVAGCELPEDEDEILDWLKARFDTVYTKDKTPFNIVMNSVAFGKTDALLPAYIKFLDYLATLKDVYIINVWQMIQWLQKPKDIDQKEIFGPCFVPKPHSDKNAKLCKLVNSDGEPRYMTVYTNKCPKSYPWLGNPAGN